MFGPLVLTAEEAATRYGQGVTALAGLQTSKQRPVEVCGVPGEQRYLQAVTCADGSSPFGSIGEIVNARVGNVGSGGRCGKIIDLYEVACAEQTYEVFMDMYFCGPGEADR